jgi:glycosyltransferase involved in cell wall biosynthesis
MNGGPLVSVIMPVHNAAGYIAESVASILGQTHGNLELIVVDDGSTDGTSEALDRFTDQRLVRRTQENRGVAEALNHALGLARGPLVARQDADDVAHPERIAAQVERFAADQSLSICGTWARIIDAHGREIGKHHHPTTDASLKYQLLFDSPFVSSSIMFRFKDKSIRFEGSTAVFEDYDLWSRLARLGSCTNIAEELVDYRVLASGLSHTTRNSMDRVIEQRRRNLLAWNGRPDAVIEPLSRLGFEHPRVTAEQLRAARDLLANIIRKLPASADERSALLSDMHQRLLGFHLRPRKSTFGKAMDRLYKEVILRTAKPA